MVSAPDDGSVLGAIMETGLALVFVDRPRVLVDVANGLVVFTEVERAKELVPFEADAAGARIFETEEG